MVTVQLWVAPLDVPGPVLARLATGLSAAECRRAERYHQAGSARRYVAGRGWLRQVLAAELGTGPGEVELVDGGGKPRLAGVGPCFNLSRSGEVALIAVSPEEVGVDVEQVDGGRALEAAPLACTPPELAGLDRLPAGERAEAFLQLWTAKEAYLKARGVGLAVPPGQVELGPGPEDAAVPARLLGEVGPGRWWVRRLRPRPGFVAAVASEGRDWVIAVRDTADLPVEGVLPGAGIRG